MHHIESKKTNLQKVSLLLLITKMITDINNGSFSIFFKNNSLSANRSEEKKKKVGRTHLQMPLQERATTIIQQWT
jgi:hypothetical protein